MQDIFEAARAKIGPGIIHSLFNSEGSYSRAGEYYILSPLRPDRNVGSFSINEETGVYIERTDKTGGDFIDLVSKARGISPLEAAQAIIAESGGTFVNSDDSGSKKTKKDKVYPDPVDFIPDTDENKKGIMSHVRQEWCRDLWGKAVNITRYFNAAGQWRFAVARFVNGQATDKKRSKTDILFYLGVDSKWHSKWHEKLKPFPALGIQKVKENDLPCLIVEGEKCGRIEVPGFNVLSWVGGTSNMNKTDWAPLRKRKVVIWPDTDSGIDKNGDWFPINKQPGMKAAHYIKSQLPRAQILEIYRAHDIETDPHGWDIADLIEEGGDPEKFIDEFMPHKDIAVDLDPHSVFNAFVEHFYDYDSLQQINAGYWRYDNKAHFWRKVIKNDILCNFQRWLEDTGLQWTISAKIKATKFINETKSYLDRHSIGYIGQNPFKDSAVAPYIHLQNGAIVMKEDSTEWIDRADYDESYFKGLYPINCLDFSFDYENYKNVDPVADCPAFMFFIRELIPHDYMEKLNQDEKDRAISDTMNFICQIIAYSLSPIKPNEYFFGIYGGQRTGKSFLLKIIKSIIGPEFCVEKKISDMDNRFASSGLWGKKVFIEPDLKTRQPLPEDFIKAYSGEQEITVEEKNLPAVDGVKTSIAMFFISNYEFHTKGLEGLARRIVLVPYKNNIEKHDPRLLAKILGTFPHGDESGDSCGKTLDERPAILALVMQSWDKFCNNDYLFESPEWAQTEKDIWLIESNSVAKFLKDDYLDNPDAVTSISRTELHENYKIWCKDEGRKPLGKKNFYEEVRREPRITEMKLAGYDNFLIAEPDADEFSDNIPF